LSEDLATLALFSDNVLCEEKKQMVRALAKPKNVTDLRRVDPKTLGLLQSASLADFVTERSKNLFSALSIDPPFLELDPETWDEYDGYKTAKLKVLALRVVNDCAERAVKLATDFSQTLTHDETQRQLVFQIVEFHRQTVSVPLKKTLTQNLFAFDK
jgi:hypothetical protein